VEEKAREKAERQRIAEKEERKRKTVEYLQWLQDKMLEEEVILLEGAEGSQCYKLKTLGLVNRKNLVLG